MRKITCAIILLVSFWAQTSAQIVELDIDCDRAAINKRSDHQLPAGQNVEIKFKGKKENIEKYFKNSSFTNDALNDGLFFVLKSIDPNLTTIDKYVESHVKTVNATFELLVKITPSIYGTADSFSIALSDNGTTADTAKIEVARLVDKDATVLTSAKAGDALTVIDPGMTASIDGSSSGCQLCDLYSKKVSIPSKHDRIYSTDYIVIYDPSLKKDAYTICKHVFEGSEKKNTLYERYIKIGAKWFAPHVGSQIRFEVINQPLSQPLKLTVDELDVFNSGSSQFASLMTNLVNSNILTPVTGGATASDSTTQQSAKEMTIPEQLNAVASQVLRYVVSFRVSSCAIQQHYTNLPLIIARIDSIFGLSAVNADQLAIQLMQKIEAEASEDDKVKAVKEAEAITTALKALENIQPLAYTTLRAKNRDYIEIKYTGSNNILSKPENIRMSGGMKIDFSAGFLLTGLKDYTYTLKDATVKYQPLDGSAIRDTTGNIIIKEDDGSNQVGVGILTHFYPRSSSHYNVGGTVGLMTSTNLNLRLMLGGSFMISSLFGSNNRVSFSGGIVWGKVKRLSIQNQDFLDHPRTVNGVPQFYSQAAAPQPIDRSEHSWFFAITMNFGGN